MGGAGRGHEGDAQGAGWELGGTWTLRAGCQDTKHLSEEVCQ